LTGLLAPLWWAAVGTAEARSHPLLLEASEAYEQLLGVAASSYGRELCTDVDRLVIARIVRVERANELLPPADPRRQEGGTYTLATLKVLRQVVGLGPSVDRFRLVMPGGRTPDGYIASVGGFATPLKGAIVVLPAIYLWDDLEDPLAWVMFAPGTRNVNRSPLPPTDEFSAAFHAACAAGAPLWPAVDAPSARR
jgi:hypothetical protein